MGVATNEAGGVGCQPSQAVRFARTGGRLVLIYAGSAPMADQGGVVSATRHNNGGINGIEDRQALYSKALKVPA